jgi:16S rRNA (cytidine1402-2'-O)-methyltransferase
VPSIIRKAACIVVATPIGNLADITLRALHLLALADAVACEDTRHTHTLLRTYGIDKPAAQLLAVHQHNEMQAARDGGRAPAPRSARSLCQRCRHTRHQRPWCPLGCTAARQRLAGRPASRRQQRLGAAERRRDRRHRGTGFCVCRVFAAKAAERAAALEGLQSQARAVVLLEAPHRIEALAQALAVWGARAVTVGRELTKQFEDIHTLPADELSTWLAADGNRLRGEFTLVLHPPAKAIEAAQDDRILALLMQHLPLKTAVQLTAQISGESKNALYVRALVLKEKPAP